MKEKGREGDRGMEEGGKGETTVHSTGLAACTARARPCCYLL